MSVNFFDNVLLFIPGDTESNFGGPVWLGCIMRNKFYDQFQKQPFWVANKRVELDGIRIDAGDIYIKSSGMIRYLGYMYHMWFTYCIVIILHNLISIPRLCMKIYQ